MPNENTPHLHLPLPHPDNLLEGDVERLRSGFTLLDEHAAQIAAALAALGTSTPAPDALPKAGADGKLALGWLPEIPDPTTVLSAPAIAGGDLIVGCPASYTLTGQSYLSGAAVATFELNFNGAIQSVSAVSNSATLELTVPAGTAAGATFELTATAVDTIGNRSKSTAVSRSAIVASVNAPAITSPVAGAIVSAVSIPLTGADFASTGTSDTQKRRRGRVCTPGGTVLFTGPWVAGSVTSLTLAPSTPLTAKATVTLQIQDEGNTLGASPWSAPVAVTVASVVQPTITSPANNAEVSDKNITLVTAAMALTGSIADTLIGADYTLYDTSGGVIAAAQSIASTSHIFTAPAVTKGSFYDLGVVQHSKNHGASIESVKCRIKIKTTRHGEILYDTSGNPAAVIVGSYASSGNDPWTIRGKPVWLAVALAAKRSVSIPWNTSSSDSNWQDITSIENPSITWKLASNNTAADGNGNYVSTQSSEANMDGSFTYSQAIKDSTALTNAIIAHNATYQAAKIARQLVLRDLGAMDLPRIETLMRIYQMRDIIDALDPTANAHTAKKLAAWGFGSASGACVWSASECDSSNAWDVGSNGRIYSNNKNTQFGVVPALELPA